MKNLLLLLTLLFVGSYICAAQGNEGRRGQRLHAVKAAFYTKELNLTVEEAQKFWPVYDPYFEELKSAKMSIRNDALKLEEAVLNIRKKYKPEFLRVLGSEQRVNKLFVTDLKFVEMLRAELKERRRKNRDNN